MTCLKDVVSGEESALESPASSPSCRLYVELSGDCGPASMRLFRTGKDEWHSHNFDHLPCSCH